MFIVTDAYGRSLGLPAYRSRRAAAQAARSLRMVCGGRYAVREAGR